MKNKIVNSFLYAILVVLLGTTNFAFAAIEVENQTVVSKLIITMGIILLSSVGMTVCLSIYNKFFVKSNNNNYDTQDLSLKTPEDRDDAIMSYIMKNRLK